ncbi:MAG: alkaline phosphatase D family protein, partial [Burkholderiaceae bacterium]
FGRAWRRYARRRRASAAPADRLTDGHEPSVSVRQRRGSISVDEVRAAVDRDGRCVERAQARFRLSARALEAADESERRDRPAPAERRGLVFAIGSCMYPPGLFDRPVAQAAYARLSRRLGAEGAADEPGLLLLLGDQVYVDDTAGLFEPTPAGDRYSRPYALTFELDAARDVMRRLPVYPMLDDHEFVDDWEHGRVADVDECRRALGKYQRWQHQLIENDTPIRDDYRYWLQPAGLPMIVLDTRSGRSGRALTAGLYEGRRLPSIDEAQLIPHRALDEILDKLKQGWSDETPKLIASSSALFPLRHEALSGDPGDRLSLDDWGGYPATWTAVLRGIHARKIRNVIFLAGDLHVSLVSSMRLQAPDAAGPDDAVVVHAIVSSGLHSPWPFANTRPEELMTDGAFRLPDPLAGVEAGAGTALEARIVTHGLSTGNGFAIARLDPETGGAWRLTVTFDMVPDTQSAVWTRTLAPWDAWTRVPG